MSDANGKATDRVTILGVERQFVDPPREKGREIFEGMMQIGEGGSGEESEDVGIQEAVERAQAGDRRFVDDMYWLADQFLMYGVDPALEEDEITLSATLTAIAAIPQWTSWLGLDSSFRADTAEVGPDSEGSRPSESGRLVS